MIRRHHLSGVPFSSVRRQLLGCSAIAALLAAFAMGPAFADEISAGPTSDRWAKRPALQGFDLTGKDLPPRLFLVRTRGGLPETEGVKVHGVRGGVFLVSGDAAVVQGLAQRGCAVIPLTDGSPPRPSQSPREWKRIEHPDPAIVDMVSQVGWEKLLEKIQWLVDYRTRYTRADNHQEIAQSIRYRLASYGLDATLLPFDFSRWTWFNVEAVQPGTVYPNSYVLICGRFDSFSTGKPMMTAPGADDNATGTAAVLTAAEILSQYEFEYSIRYICFAGEELGLRGSYDYASWARQNRVSIVGVLNFDMLGYWEPGVPKDLEIETNEASQWLAAAIVNAADLYTDVPYELHVFDGAWWGDHASFWDQGYAAVNHEEAWDWKDPDFNPHYHSFKDLPKHLDSDFTVGNTRIAVAALATLARPVRPLEIVFDLRPGSCVNPFNPKSRGVVTALVLGSDDLDVRDIDAASLRIEDSVAPSMTRIVDMASATHGGGHPCTDTSPDGIADLSLKFPAAGIAATLGAATKHETVTLRLTGTLNDGTKIEGEDVVAIVGNVGGGPQRAEETAVFATSLGTAVPNPFNPATQISYTLERDTYVVLDVYDVRGRLVARLIDGGRPKGEHTAVWNAESQPSGLYFYRLQTSDHVSTRKFVLLK